MFKRSKPKQPATPQRVPARSTAAPLRRSSFSYHRASHDASSKTGQAPEKTKKRSTLRNGNAKQSHRQVWWKHIPTFLALGVILFCVVYETVLSTNPKVIIVSSNSSGTKLNLSASTYKNAAQKLFKGSISNHDKLTIDTNSIAGSMQKHFPELANVSITLPVLGHRPIVYLEPLQPVLVLQNQIDGNTLIGSNGVAMERLSSPSAAGQLPAVTDQANVPVSLGKIAMTQSDVSFVQLVASQMQAAHITIQSMDLPPASRELDVHLAGLPYYVKFNLNDSGNAKQQVGTFLATKQYLSSQGVTPSQYIDARVPGRVYYK